MSRAAHLSKIKEIRSAAPASDALYAVDERGLELRADRGGVNGRHRFTLDFVSDAFADGPRSRILAIVDDFTRGCLALVADTAGLRVARELDSVIATRRLLNETAFRSGQRGASLTKRKSTSDLFCIVEQMDA
jgi:hypothetical protein